MVYLNLLLVACIVASLVIYFYFKTKQLRSTLPIRSKWYKAKSGMALSAFIVSFGLNATILYPDFIGFIVAAVFLIIGVSLGTNNYKRMRHEGRFIKEEYELNK